MAELSKERIRARMRLARAGLSPARALALSQTIQELVLQAPFYRGARAVALYAPLPGEVDTTAIASEALSAGRRLFYPRIEPAGDRLALVEVTSLGRLESGPFGIVQPPPGPALETLAPGPSVIVVPGVAFGRAGQRLGRGKGFYDRFLAGGRRGAVVVGLAFSFQVLDDLPQSAWDQPMDYLATELALLRAAPVGQADREPDKQGGVLR